MYIRFSNVMNYMLIVTIFFLSLVDTFKKRKDNFVVFNSPTWCIMKTEVQ